MALHRSVILSGLLFLVWVANAATLTVSGTVLVLSSDATKAKTASSGLRGYGIPYKTVVITAKTDPLPALNSSASVGNYGAIVIGREGLLGTAQLQAIYDYQTAFNVRLVRWDASPSADYGTKSAIAGAGCCDTTVSQQIFLTNTSAFPTAGLRLNAGLATKDLWHQPAVITNSSIAWEVAAFSAAGSFTTQTTAAVINKIGKREQMVWFFPFEPDWSPTSAALQHAWIHWLTRGLYVGYRRVQLNTHVDDVHLNTYTYDPGDPFRLRPADLDAHKQWTANLNARLNAGSNYFIELAHNGNGNIDWAADMNVTACKPGEIAYVRTPSQTPNEWMKALGTGTDCWPTTPASFIWSTDCINLDPLANWFSIPSNLNAYAHVSHTFTHESLNNATYSDAQKEIMFNKAWLISSGIASATKFSASGLVPPAITGLHNGDVIRAWTDTGISAVVGDNTRAPLLNTQNEYWPLITTIDQNGYAGLPIIPRWATNVYYNCDLPACISAEYEDMYGPYLDFGVILASEKTANLQHFFSLRHDPYMFHQANMRQDDAGLTSYIGGTSQKLSLLQIWVETMVAEITRVTTWPITTKKFDDMAAEFKDRMTRDNCNPSFTYNIQTTTSGGGGGPGGGGGGGGGGRAVTTTASIVSITVSAGTTSSCSVPIPVTFPARGTVPRRTTSTEEKLGDDPLTIWVKLDGDPVTIDLSKAIDL